MFDDKVIRLREWGTRRTHTLPSRRVHDWHIGTSNTCSLRLVDPSISPQHAVAFRVRGQWHIRDLQSTTGLRQDGELRKEFALTPGVEIGIGAMTMIAESERSIALREFCARLLGWGDDRMSAIDHALRTIRLAVAHRFPLILRGEGDQIMLAHALHRRVLGDAAPFIVCDYRRRDLPASVRSPTNHSRAEEALALAAGGSLCIRNRRPPPELPELLRRIDAPDSRVQLIVCMGSHERYSWLFAGPMLIEVPPLGIREIELPRIIRSYADDALAALHASPPCFSERDLDWIKTHSATSLSEVEKAAFRIVALKKAMGNAAQAAAMLGMAPVSLTRWLDRRVLPTDSASEARIP